MTDTTDRPIREHTIPCQAVDCVEWATRCIAWRTGAMGASAFYYCCGRHAVQWWAR